MASREPDIQSKLCPYGPKTRILLFSEVIVLTFFGCRWKGVTPLLWLSFGFRRSRLVNSFHLTKNLHCNFFPSQRGSELQPEFRTWWEIESTRFQHTNPKLVGSVAKNYALRPESIRDLYPLDLQCFCCSGQFISYEHRLHKRANRSYILVLDPFLHNSSVENI